MTAAQPLAPGPLAPEVIAPELDGLAALVRDCAASGVGRRALLLRTDLLPARLSRPHHLRLARAALEPLTTADRARLHDLSAGRVAISWRGESPSLLRQSLAALEHLLQDAPLDAPGLPELVRLFDLPREGAALMQAANTVRPPPRAAVAAPAARRAAVAPLAPLDPRSLLGLEKGLAMADLSRFARRQRVRRLGQDGLRTAWEARTLSLPELMDSLLPGHDAEADPWLLRHLGRTLDRRMLALLASADELRGAGPFSLPLNVASILGPEFLRFDAALPGRLRGRVVLCLRLDDVLTDPAAFTFARDFARARSYRLLLQGVAAPLLPALALPRLDLDYVQLQWSAGLAALGLGGVDAGAARWVLAGADDPAATEWGRAQGVGLFMGAAPLSGTPAP